MAAHTAPPDGVGCICAERDNIAPFVLLVFDFYVTWSSTTSIGACAFHRLLAPCGLKMGMSPRLCDTCRCSCCCSPASSLQAPQLVRLDTERKISPQLGMAFFTAR